MPELPEVETVRNTLKKEVLNRIIKDVEIYYENIIAYPDISLFKKQIKGQRINDILRRGKFLMFSLDNFLIPIGLKICIIVGNLGYSTHLLAQREFFYWDLN